MGAWIETRLGDVSVMYSISRTLYGCVDWNSKVYQYTQSKTSRTLYGCVDWNTPLLQTFCLTEVAPYMGAWIETSAAILLTSSISVAPYMGAWIETYRFRFTELPVRRTLYGCVDWNGQVGILQHLRSRRTLYGCVDWNQK